MCLGLGLGLGLGLRVCPGGEVRLRANPLSAEFPFQARHKLQITATIPEIPIAFSSEILAFPTEAWLCWSWEMNPLNAQHDALNT